LVQLPEPHFTWQLRATQTSPVWVQSVHCPPPVAPQAPSWVPSTQTLFWQQPVLQLSGPQVGGWHAPAWQTSTGAWFTQFEQS
jgi:hypothetical protein